MSWPDVNRVRQHAVELAAQIRLGRSAFLDAYGVGSELAYKQQSMAAGRIMYHAHIGMNDVASTSAAVAKIHRELSARDFRLDRAGFALDRRMGLPTALRHRLPAETGPLLSSPGDWRRLANAAPIQPHFGDFMIGLPAAVSNTSQALSVGCTTIGNLSQFFTFEAPGWDDAAATATQTYQSIVLLSQFRDRGTMLHSYLEDGYGALFQKCASVAAWAMLERYLVEELIGARLSHCIGGLTSDPLKRAAWVLALQRIHQGELVGSMIYGDTISFGQDYASNRAPTAEYLLWDILTQLHRPSGHAVLPLPVSEAIRIPSADEIIEAQLFGRQIEAAARRLYPHVDFRAVEEYAQRLFRQGRQIFRNALDGLQDQGIDIRNPLQLLMRLKQMGAQEFERAFAADVVTDESPDTDMFAMSQAVIARYRPIFAEPGLRARVAGKRFVVASSDVHVHAVRALAQLLRETDAEVIYLGAEQTPEDLVACLQHQVADALLLSTHNGMALAYAEQLKQLLNTAEMSLPVIMGGVLNQKTEGQALPVPVIAELKSLGMYPVSSLPGMVRLLPGAG